MPRVARAAFPWLAAAMLVGALAGCTVSGDEEAAGDVARRFATGRPAEACALLAADTLRSLTKNGTCADAVGKAVSRSRANVQRVEVAGQGAFVVLDDQTVFLAHFADGWRIVAAGCQAPATDGDPYDCEVEP